MIHPICEDRPSFFRGFDSLFKKCWRISFFFFASFFFLCSFSHATPSDFKEEVGRVARNYAKKACCGYEGKEIEESFYTLGCSVYDTVIDFCAEGHPWNAERCTLFSREKLKNFLHKQTVPVKLQAYMSDLLIHPDRLIGVARSYFDKTLPPVRLGLKYLQNHKESVGKIARNYAKKACCGYEGKEIEESFYTLGCSVYDTVIDFCAEGHLWNAEKCTLFSRESLEVSLQKTILPLKLQGYMKDLLIHPDRLIGTSRYYFEQSRHMARNQFLETVSDRYITALRNMDSQKGTIVWGGDLELSIMSELKNLSFHIYHYERDVQGAILKDPRSNQPLISSYNLGLHQGRKIDLLFDGCHYEPYKLLNKKKVSLDIGSGHCLFVAVLHFIHGQDLLDSASVSALRNDVADTLAHLIDRINKKEKIQHDGTAENDYQPLEVALTHANNNPVYIRFSSIFESITPQQLCDAIADLPKGELVQEAVGLHHLLQW